MTSGYKNITIAEARQRLQDILRGIDGVLKLQKQAKEQEQYNFDPSPLYEAARHDVLAVTADFNVFQQFIDENKTKLYGDEVSYYMYKIENIKMQLDNLENTIIIPSLTAPIPTGSEENTTDVGRSFEGVVISVPDADTIVVKQTIPGKEDALAANYTVRIAGIEATESGTECGKHSATKSSEFWLNKPVIVYFDRHTPNDLYGRVLGTVYYQDVNFALWSLDRCYSSPNLKFGKNHYVDPDEIKQVFARCLSGCPLSGSIKVTTTPTHAVVRYGKVGETLIRHLELTPCDIVLPVGDYRIAISAPGCGTVIDDVTVTPYKQQLPVYTLQKIPAQNAQVIVEVAPIGKAVVYIDGNMIGVAPISIELPVGVQVVVSVEVDGFNIPPQNVVPVIGEVKKLVFIP